MAGITIPSTAGSDYDFLAFSFAGKHSWDDFKIIRVSDGDRYNLELAPQLQDKTAEVPGSDGTYYFGTNHKQKVFNINFAFEKIDDSTLKKLKQWLNGKEMGDLWFEEEPYKVYSVKVTGQPNIKYLSFEENGDRVYRGEGTVQFTAYWPYAHTPDGMQNIEDYWGFANTNYWRLASGLVHSTGRHLGENPGELPAPFVLIINAEVTAGTTITVGDASIQIKQTYSNIEWDSRTGIVKSKDTNLLKDSLVEYSGMSIATIPVGGIDISRITIKQKSGKETPGDYRISEGKWQYLGTDGTEWNDDKEKKVYLNYHYWYY